MRWLLGSIQDWDALMEQAYRVLRPGGYIESLETSAIMTSDDGTVTEDCPMGQWGKFFISGGKKIGRSFTVVEDETQRKSIEAAGFVDIQEFNFKVRRRLDNQNMNRSMTYSVGLADADRRLGKRSEAEGTWAGRTDGPRERRRGLHCLHGKHAGVDAGGDFGVHQHAAAGCQIEKLSRIL